MTYDKDSHITTVKEVESFFDYLLLERKVNFHPDNDFSDYICYATKEPTFTNEEVTIFNRLMDEAFDVCEENNVDIYEIGCDKLWALLNVSSEGD